MSVVCEIDITDDKQCGIDAFERCAQCKRAFCRSHQAWQRTARQRTGEQRLIRPIQSWCAECQARQEKELEEAELARVKEHAECLRAAKSRITVLLDALDAAGFPGAVERAVFKTEKGVFGHMKTTKATFDSAIPVGQVSWEYRTYYPRDGGDGFKHLNSLETGITRDRQYVRMDPGLNGSDWKMSDYSIQICEALEAHARKYLS